MKAVLSILILLLTHTSSFSQSLIWEKRYTMRRAEFYSVEQYQDSSYVVIGESLHSRFIVTGPGNVGNTQYVGLFQSRLTKNGDTLWARPLEISRAFIGMSLDKQTGISYIMLRPQLFVDTNFRYPYFHLLRTDSAANVLSRHTYKLPITSQSANGMFRASNGDLIVFGYTSPGIIWTNTQCDWLLMRIAPDGRLKWWKVYNPQAAFACGCSAAEDPEGNILMAGVKDRMVSYQIVDSLGNVKRQPTDINFHQQNAAPSRLTIRRHPSGNLVFSAVLSVGSPSVLYGNLVMADTNGRVLWHVQNPTVSSRPYVTQSGNIVLFWTTVGLNAGLRNYDEFGVQVNALEIIDLRGTRSGGMGFNGELFYPDGSAVGVGAYSPPPGLQTDGYIAKIANIGVPYDPLALPWQVAGPREVGTLVPYPNPTAGSTNLRVSGGHVVVYDLQGRVAMQATLQGTTTASLDLSPLPPGLYHFLLQDDMGKKWRGKVRRE